MTATPPLDDEPQENEMDDGGLSSKEVARRGDVQSIIIGLFRAVLEPEAAEKLQEALDNPATHGGWNYVHSFQDRDGNAPLHWLMLFPFALPGRLTDCIRFLAGQKANLNLTNRAGQTPLHIAVEQFAASRHHEGFSSTVIQELLVGEADINASDSQDRTPLFEALQAGDVKICQLLLEEGADSLRSCPDGRSLQEYAMRHPNMALRRLFRHVQAEDFLNDPDWELTLQHVVTGGERRILVGRDASMADIKRLMARAVPGSCWKEIALLTEQGRLLEDKDHLNGRNLLLMVEATSAVVKQAREQQLPEELLWPRWSTQELRQEAERRGVYPSLDRSKVLSRLADAKRWERFTSTELRTVISQRNIHIESGNLDDFSLLTLLKQDSRWQDMPQPELYAECSLQGLTTPVEGSTLTHGALIARLRKARFWTHASIATLKSSCQDKNYSCEGRTRQEMIAFLKTFTTLPPPKKPTPAPPPPPTPPSAPQPPPQQQASSHKEPAPDTRASSTPGRKEQTGSKVPRGAKTRQKPTRSSTFDDIPEGPQSQKEGYDYLTDRVKKLLKRYPNFDGALTEEMNDWAENDLRVYFESQGMLRPPKKQKNKLTKAQRKAYLSLFGLDETATMEEVKSSFRKMAMQFHPDKEHVSQEADVKKMQDVTEAYDALRKHRRGEDELKGSS